MHCLPFHSFCINSRWPGWRRWRWRRARGTGARRCDSESPPPAECWQASLGKRACLEQFSDYVTSSPGHRMLWTQGCRHRWPASPAGAGSGWSGCSCHCELNTWNQDLWKWTLEADRAWLCWTVGLVLFIKHWLRKRILTMKIDWDTQWSWQHQWWLKPLGVEKSHNRTFGLLVHFPHSWPVPWGFCNLSKTIHWV